jgi:LuxR family transcriptional regulator, maltose regulon positive regulatory protein
MCVVADAEAIVESAASGARRWLVPRPGLFELLGEAERVVQVSAPTGSGKTFLLRSWIAAEGLGNRTAWVSVGRGERDPQRVGVHRMNPMIGPRLSAMRS